MSPWAAPKTVPIPKAAAMATGAAVPPRIQAAMKMEVKATTEPTDKSMPPARSTNVMPTAAMPGTALLPRRFEKTRTLRRLS